MSSWSALESHLADALIHKTRSSFMDVLPLLACVNNRSRPIRADRLSKQSISDRIDIDLIIFAHLRELRDSSCLPNQVLAHRIKHDFRGVVQIELLHEIRPVTLDGIQTDVKNRSHFFIAFAFCQ
jgi:hypothetical protein